MSRAVAFIAVAATAVNGQGIPPEVGDLINLIPATCLLQAQTAVIPCFLENTECLSNLPTAEEIGMLPIPEEISTCEDLLDPTCPLLLDCEACLTPLGDLMKCIIANLDPDVPQETKDLIEGCPVDCDMDMGEGGMTEGNMTEAPVAVPTIAPVAVPTDAPSASGSTEGTPMPSAASQGVLSLAAVAVAAAALAF